MALKAYQIERRLVAEEPAEMCGDTNRSADVAAHAQISQAGGESCSASARGSARTSLHVPGIIALAVNRVVALPVRQRDGHIGSAQQHSAGIREQMGYHVRIFRRFGIAQRRKSPCAWMTGHSKTFFHRNGNAMENAAGTVAR